MIYQPTFFEPFPAILAFDDWHFVEPPDEGEFFSFLLEIDYQPAYRLEGPDGVRMTFLSGVSALFAHEKLHSVRLLQRASKEATSSTLSNEREPSTSQILNMLDEADIALKHGALRAALLIAWAGLEAALRQTALRAGKQGKIGVQPAILIRELFETGKLTLEEHRSIEELRQLRTAFAHGLAPINVDRENISRISRLSKRLIDELNKTP